MSDLKIVIVGAGGRMGRALVRDVTAADGLVVHAATEHEGNALLGQDAGSLAGIEPLGVLLTDNVLEAVVDADAVIDFTTPAATVEHAALCAQARITHVIGTTGLSDDDEAKIKAAARHATIIKAGNFSLGVNLLAALTRKVATMLDEDWDIEISEMHHRHKVDAPSGTALMLGDAAADGRGKNLDDIADRGRDGITGARKQGDIGLVALRGGSVVGDHSVIFAAENEILELTHRAGDRTIFARGAVRAARWGQGKPPGLYDMADVLALD